MECPVPIIFRPLKPPEPTRPGDKAPGETDPPLHVGTIPTTERARHAWCGGAGKRSGASARRPFSFIGQARYGNYGQTAIMVEFTDTIINMPETDRD